MSYSGSMTLSSFYMPQSVSNQAVSSGLFENCLSKQNLFHNEFSMPCFGGNTAILFSISLRSDGDVNLPTASIGINGADTISTRVASQVCTEAYTNQRLYQSSNPFICTRSKINLTINILDTGDLVYLNRSTFLMLPIKD